MTRFPGFSFGLWVLLGALGAGCVSRDRYDQLAQIKAVQDRQVDELKRTVGELDRRAGEFQRRAELAALELERERKKGATLTEGYDRVLAQLKTWEERYGKLPPGVTVEARPEGIAFSVEGEVLFDSGKFVIKPQGKATLLDLSRRIRDQDADVVVEGHTDNVPVFHTLKEFPKGNLELSGRRALEVADFLVREGKIVEARVSFAGYGEHRPKSDNASAEGRRQNRRVELLLRQRPGEK